MPRLASPRLARSKRALLHRFRERIRHNQRGGGGGGGEEDEDGELDAADLAASGRPGKDPW